MKYVYYLCLVSSVSFGLCWNLSAENYYADTGSGSKGSDPSAITGAQAAEGEVALAVLGGGGDSNSESGDSSSGGSSNASGSNARSLLNVDPADLASLSTIPSTTVMNGIFNSSPDAAPNSGPSFSLGVGTSSSGSGTGLSGSVGSVSGTSSVVSRVPSSISFQKSQACGCDVGAQMSGCRMIRARKALTEFMDTVDANSSYAQQNYNRIYGNLKKGDMKNQLDTPIKDLLKNTWGVANNAYMNPEKVIAAWQAYEELIRTAPDTYLADPPIALLAYRHFFSVVAEQKKYSAPESMKKQYSQR